MASPNTTTTSTLKGILLYQPRGAAAEYAKWALNLYNGSTHGCTYCYNRRGMLSHAFSDKPKLAAPIVKRAKILQDEYFRKHEYLENPIPPDNIDALHFILNHDVEKIGLSELKRDGVFMSFKCDPLEDHTQHMTLRVLKHWLHKGIPVTILTKSTEWINNRLWDSFLEEYLYNKLAQLTIGVTLTGMDDMEPNAPSTAERIALLKTIRDKYPNIKTFVSLEPVIDITKAMNDVLYNIYGHTDEIRIGCQSPLKRDRYDPQKFLSLVIMLYKLSPSPYDEHIVTRITFKHSVRAQVEFFPPDIRDLCLAFIYKIEENQTPIQA